MIRNFTLALSTLTLLSSVAFANPEADGIGRKVKTAPAGVVLVKRDNNGVNQFYRVSKKVNPEQLTAMIEKLQKTGKADGVEVVKSTQLKTSAAKSGNAEAEESVAKTSWFHWHNNYRYGGYPGYGYYSGYWPQNYYYTTNYYRPTYNSYYTYNYHYGWSYGCGGHTYGIYYIY